MTRIFITGVSGFVGTSLVNFFQNDSEVILFGHSRTIPEVEKKYQGLKINFVEHYNAAVFDSLQIDCIIHLAGIAHDLSNKYVEDDYFQVNDKATRKIYDDFRQSRVKKFIYLSSIKAAIDHFPGAVDETVTPNPVTPYGKSKLQAEAYIQAQSLPADKTYFILRPCMIHGPSNKGNLNLLYKFVKTGIPYPLGAFDNQRSFLSADNLNFIIGKLVSQPIAGGVYHLADSETLSTTEVVRTIAKALNRSPRVWNLPRSLMKFIFSLYNKSMLNKLTENMVVSNKKIMSALNEPVLPCSAQHGLIKTIKSFL